MKTRSFVYVSALLFACGAPAGCLAASCPPLNPNLTSFVSQLQKLQYNVQCGSVSFNLNTQGQCLDSQGFTNPSTCYGQYGLPTRNGGAPTLTQLDDDEAILTIGNLPPPVFYYGYYTYIYGRINPTVLPPAYVNIRTPIGPVMNQRNADPGLHAQLGGNAFQLFGQPTAILTTANTITQSDIISALSSVYGASKTQNGTYVEKLPVDLVNLGSSGTADTLQTAIRVNPFTTSPGQFDPTAVAYMQTPPPMVIFRISPSIPRTHVASATYHLVDDPLPATKIVPGQVWEQTLFTNIGVTNASQALSTIVNNVVNDRAAKGKKLLSMVSAFPSILLGRSCIAAFQQGVAMAQQSGTQLVVTQNMLCNDASPDADYFNPNQQQFSFPSGGEIVWVGVNHGTLGSATYSSVSLQTPPQYQYALSHADLNGSAAPFLGGVPAAASSDFYVVSVNEACAKGSSNCIHAPGNTVIFLVERLYLAPMTATMPDYTDIIPSVWLVFN